MFGDSTHGVGAGVSANAEVVSALSATAIQRVLVENLVIMLAPQQPAGKIDLA
jgi:hypothetical protein